VFSDSGFVLELPDFVSGEPEVTATIQAVEIDDVTNDCAPLLSGEKEVVELSATPQIPELADLNAQPDVVVDPAGNESWLLIWTARFPRSILILMIRQPPLSRCSTPKPAGSPLTHAMRTTMRRVSSWA